MKKLVLLSLMSVIVFVLWMLPQPVLAQHHAGVSAPRPAAMAARTGSFKCRVIEVGEQAVVVEGKYQGKVQRLTLNMDQQTKKEGILAAGSEVKVKYREDPGGLLYAMALKGPKIKTR